MPTLIPCYVCGQHPGTICAPDQGHHPGDDHLPPRLLCPHCIEDYTTACQITFALQNKQDPPTPNPPITPN